MKNKKYVKNCELSKTIWEIKDAGLKYSLVWKLRKKSRSYTPGDKFCKLCLEEIDQIMFYKEEVSLLNSKNELYKKCRHKAKFKLNFEEKEKCS